MSTNFTYLLTAVATFIVLRDIYRDYKKSKIKKENKITVKKVQHAEVEQEIENTITEKEIILAIAHLVDTAERCDKEAESGLADAFKIKLVDSTKVAEYRNFKKGESYGLHIAVNVLNHILHHNQNFEDVEEG